MKLLTTEQKKWIAFRKIEVGRSYPFPRWGFTMYSSPSYSSGVSMDTNPFTRSLDHERFLVKGKVDGFCLGNFEDNPKGPDFYMKETDLEMKDWIEISFLMIFCFLPMVINNLLKGKLNKVKK